MAGRVWVCIASNDGQWHYVILRAVFLSGKTELLRVSSGKDLQKPCPAWDDLGCSPLNNGQVMKRILSTQGHLLQDRGYIFWVPPVQASGVAPGIGCHHWQLQGRADRAQTAWYHGGYCDGCGPLNIRRGRNRGDIQDHPIAVYFHYGEASTELRQVVDSIMEWLWNSYLTWAAYCAPMKRNLIEMENQPGTRPVDIGETWQWCFTKCILVVDCPEAKGVFRTEQLCGGLEAVIEGGIHVMRLLWKQHSQEESCGVPTNWRVKCVQWGQPYHNAVSGTSWVY